MTEKPWRPIYDVADEETRLFKEALDAAITLINCYRAKTEVAEAEYNFNNAIETLRLSD